MHPLILCEARREGWSLSLFALSERCEGVAISGAKYSGEGFELSPSFPLGVSNEFTGREAHVSVRKGTLAVVWSHRLDDALLRG